jgi:hypothetical protein
MTLALAFVLLFLLLLWVVAGVVGWWRVPHHQKPQRRHHPHPPHPRPSNERDPPTEEREDPQQQQQQQRNSYHRQLVREWSEYEEYTGRCAWVTTSPAKRVVRGGGGGKTAQAGYCVSSVERRMKPGMVATGSWTIPESIPCVRVSIQLCDLMAGTEPDPRDGGKGGGEGEGLSQPHRVWFQPPPPPAPANDGHSRDGTWYLTGFPIGVHELVTIELHARWGHIGVWNHARQIWAWLASPRRVPSLTSPPSSSLPHSSDTMPLASWTVHVQGNLSQPVEFEDCRIRHGTQVYPLHTLQPRCLLAAARRHRRHPETWARPFRTSDSSLDEFTVA